MEYVIITALIILGIGALILLFWKPSASDESANESARESTYDEWRRNQEEESLKRKREDERRQDIEIDKRKTALAPILHATREALRITPTAGESHARLGHVNASLANWQDARDAYERALAFGVSDERDRAIVHLLYGRLLTRLRLPVIDHQGIANYNGLTDGTYLTIQDFIPWSIEEEDSPTLDGILRDLKSAKAGDDENGLWNEPYDADVVRYHFNEAIRLLERRIKKVTSDIDAMQILAQLYERSGRTKSRVRLQLLIREVEIRGEVDAQQLKCPSGPAYEKGVAFEHRCLSVLKAMGYEVTRVGGSGDGGIDIRAKDATPLRSSSIIVQCKDQKQSISEPKVRELYGLIVSEGVHKGVFMTTADFTAPARKFAEGKRLELIDGSALNELEGRSA